MRVYSAYSYRLILVCHWNQREIASLRMTTVLPCFSADSVENTGYAT